MKDAYTDEIKVVEETEETVLELEGTLLEDEEGTVLVLALEVDGTELNNAQCGLS